MEIPKCISELEKLVYLDLSFNKLDKIPKSIGTLENLECLFLNNNQITKIPSSLCQLQKLRELFINDNKIMDLSPDLIASSNQLEKFYCNNNLISAKTKNRLKFLAGKRKRSNECDEGDVGDGDMDEEPDDDSREGSYNQQMSDRQHETDDENNQSGEDDGEGNDGMQDEGYLSGSAQVGEDDDRLRQEEDSNDGQMSDNDWYDSFNRDHDSDAPEND